MGSATDCLGFFLVLSLKRNPSLCASGDWLVQERREEEVCQRGFQTMGFVDHHALAL